MPVSQVVFHVTERCALSCVHCLRDPAKQPAELPAEAMEKVLREAVALHRVGHVGFTGGDPVLHSGLAKVVDVAVELGLTWHLVTSGFAFDRLLALLEADARRRAALTIVDLSLDGADATVHDGIRGAGSFRAVMSAALALTARKIPFNVQMTVNALNVHQVEALGLLAAKLGAASASFGMTQPTGTPDDARLWLSPDAWGHARDEIERLGSLLAIPVRATEGFARPQPFHACSPWRSELLHVDPRGRLSLCCMLSGAPGGEEDVIADLATASLLDAHRRLLDVVHGLQRERLDAVARGLDAWESFQCNWCARRHGRPYWIDGGSAGTRARRAGTP